MIRKDDRASGGWLLKTLLVAVSAVPMVGGCRRDTSKDVPEPIPATGQLLCSNPRAAFSDGVFCVYADTDEDLAYEVHQISHGDVHVLYSGRLRSMSGFSRLCMACRIHSVEEDASRLSVMVLATDGMQIEIPASRAILGPVGFEVHDLSSLPYVYVLYCVPESDDASEPTVEELLITKTAEAIRDISRRKGVTVMAISLKPER